MGVFRDSTLPQGFGGQLNIWLLAGKYIYSKLGIRVNGLYICCLMNIFFHVCFVGLIV